MLVLRKQERFIEQVPWNGPAATRLAGRRQGTRRRCRSGADLNPHGHPRCRLRELWRAEDRREWRLVGCLGLERRPGYSIRQRSEIEPVGLDSRRRAKRRRRAVALGAAGRTVVARPAVALPRAVVAIGRAAVAPQDGTDSGDLQHQEQREQSWPDEHGTVRACPSARKRAEEVPSMHGPNALAPAAGASSSG